MLKTDNVYCMSSSSPSRLVEMHEGMSHPTLLVSGGPQAPALGLQKSLRCGPSAPLGC
jgi:hypothetical protein